MLHFVINIYRFSIKSPTSSKYWRRGMLSPLKWEYHPLRLLARLILMIKGDRDNLGGSSATTTTRLFLPAPPTTVNIGPDKVFEIEFVFAWSFPVRHSVQYCLHWPGTRMWDVERILICQSRTFYDLLCLVWSGHPRATVVVVERCRVVEFACAVLFYGAHREREREI